MWDAPRSASLVLHAHLLGEALDCPVLRYPSGGRCGLAGAASARVVRSACERWQACPRSVSGAPSTARGFEPLRAEPNGCLVHHLSHSVTRSHAHSCVQQFMVSLSTVDIQALSLHSCHVVGWWMQQSSSATAKYSVFFGAVVRPYAAVRCGQERCFSCL